MKTKILLALVSVAAAGLSYGQTLVTQTLYFSGVPDFETPLVFSKYAGNASDIQNVSIDYDLTISGGQFVVDNDADTPAEVAVKFGARLDATSLQVTMLNHAFSAIINDVEATNQAQYLLTPNFGDGLNDYDPTPTDGAVLVGATVNEAGGDDVHPLFWSQYAGGGTFTVNVKASQIGSLSYNSGVETATTPVVANGSITVSYLVVPEVSSSVLLGISALGLAFRRRR
ncbi:MAG: PEP-CTERM sorting domain-containing protein [Verrucomicrobia bacterium]|nr:PEP-CTERM sorting domain-containing protein [Verrucomicrobiota bacterium]